jgi:hypothetical protein
MCDQNSKFDSKYNIHESTMRTSFLISCTFFFKLPIVLFHFSVVLTDAFNLIYSISDRPGRTLFARKPLDKFEDGDARLTNEAFRQQPFEGSFAEKELRSIRYQSFVEEDDLDYADYEDDMDFVDHELEPWEENDSADEDYNSESGPEIGNFWTNPRPGLDPIPPIRRQTISDSRSNGVPRRRPSSQRQTRTTFRSGTPTAPRPLQDLYDRLFWYGMDEEDGDWVPKSYDKTVFGGTRGKFNALAYLEDGYDSRPPPRRIKRNLPPTSYDSSIDDFNNYEEDDNAPFYPNEVETTYDDMLRSRSTTPNPRRNAQRESMKDRNNNPQRQRRTNDWVNSEVSSWFGDDDDTSANNGERKRTGRSSSSRNNPSRENPIFKFLDNLLDVDRNEMETKAMLYEQRVRSRRRSSNNQKPTPQAWSSSSFDENSFDDELFEENDVVVDIEIQPESDDQTNMVDTDLDREGTKLSMSWEERSRRLEQVPPVGVPAWGPTGDLGIDARTKAMLDALEQLREAREQLKVKCERTKLTRDEIVILRTDEALARKKLQSDPRRGRERLRYIQLDIEQAARELRKAQNAERSAQRRLEYLQDKYWAILNLYDTEMASKEVDESLLELTKEEPAAQSQESLESSSDQSD